ncbi:hypothetical protein H5410_057464 [Solanum commersonii]|uniref:DUF4283 domain-containing protein n=1 Tax=Solanum commersonii TaxID=4109 RepID=A0A9J5WP37_SOLCO|nr:hypothetical protein H5410_057464 [Solanum commersonii]
MFKQIGDRCGGFIETEEETTLKNHLHWARIKVHGDGKEVPREIELNSDGFVYTIPIWVESPVTVRPEKEKGKTKGFCPADKGRSEDLRIIGKVSEVKRGGTWVHLNVGKVQTLGHMEKKRRRKAHLVLCIIPLNMQLPGESNLPVEECAHVTTTEEWIQQYIVQLSLEFGVDFKGCEEKAKELFMRVDNNKSQHKGTQGTTKRKGMYELKGQELDSKFELWVRIKRGYLHSKINDYEKREETWGEIGAARAFLTGPWILSVTEFDDEMVVEVCYHEGMLWKEAIVAKYGLEDKWMTKIVTTPYGCSPRAIVNLWPLMRSNKGEDRE